MTRVKQEFGSRTSGDWNSVFFFFFFPEPGIFILSSKIFIAVVFL